MSLRIMATAGSLKGRAGLRWSCAQAEVQSGLCCCHRAGARPGSAAAMKLEVPGRMAPVELQAGGEEGTEKLLQREQEAGACKLGGPKGSRLP